MKKLALVAVACAALATPALASDHTTVTVVLKNTAFVSQGGNGHGQANVAFVAQGVIATNQAPRHDPTVVINTGFIPVGSP
jgi:opacity protein-like surface antigen